MARRNLEDVLNKHQSMPISYIDLFNKKYNDSNNEKSTSNEVEFYRLTCDMRKYLRSVVPYIYNCNENFIVIHLSKFDSFKGEFVLESYLGVETKGIINVLNKTFDSVEDKEMNNIIHKVMSYNSVHSHIIWIDELRRCDENNEINIIDGEYAIVEVFSPVSLCELDRLIIRHEEFYKSLEKLEESEMKIIREERRENRNFKEGEIRLENRGTNESQNHNRQREREYEFKEKAREEILCELVGDGCAHSNGELTIKYLDDRCIKRNRNRNEARGRVRDRCENICEYRKEMKEIIRCEGELLSNMLEDTKSSIEYLLESRNKGAFNTGIYLFSDKEDAKYIYSIMFSNFLTMSHAVKEYNVFDITNNKHFIENIIPNFNNKSLFNDFSKNQKNNLTSLIDSGFIVNRFI